MSCNCNHDGNNCGLPNQPNYNNLNNGFIKTKKRNCCNKPDKEYRKYILINSRNIYPNEGIYIESIDNDNILCLTMLPDEYYYHVIVTDDFNLTKIKFICNDRPNHKYNNTYKCLINNYSSNNIEIENINNYIRLNTIISNDEDFIEIINSNENSYFEIDTTANTIIILNDDIKVKLECIDSELEDINANIENNLSKIQSNINRIEYLEKNNIKIFNYKEFIFDYKITQSYINHYLLTDYIPKGKYIFDRTLSYNGNPTEPYDRPSIIVCKLETKMLSLETYGSKEMQYLILGIYDIEDIIDVPEAAKIYLAGANKEYLQYMMDNNITDNYTECSTEFNNTVSNIWILPYYDNINNAYKYNSIINSFVAGNASNATGNNSFASGYATSASGNQSHAEGNQTIASAPQAHAEGWGTQAANNGAHAEGDETIASGAYSHSEGESTQAIGNYSHTEGNRTIASGHQSHAEGWGSKAMNNGAHAEGDSTIVYAVYAHAEGGNSVAGYAGVKPDSNTLTTPSNADDDAGGYAHAEGAATLAIGKASHAEGISTFASGDFSHAEGSSTIGIGSGSHAEGGYTRAEGTYSHAEGMHNYAINYAQHVCGKYGVIDTTGKAIMQVGVGRSSTDRKDGFVIYTDGTFKFGADTGDYVMVSVDDFKALLANKPTVLEYTLPYESIPTTFINTSYFIEATIINHTINGKNVKILFDSKIRNIWKEAFYGNTEIVSIKIPDEIFVVEQNAFGGAQLLQTVEFSKNLRTIKDSAFTDCGIKTITLPDSLKTIGEQAFESCVSLTYADLGNSCVSVGRQAFYGCTALEHITFGAATTLILGGCINGCTSLKTITCAASTPPELYAGNYLTNVETVYVPAESVEAYKSANIWSQYADIIQPYVNQTNE